MKRVVFDIETVGVDFASLDALSQEYLLKYADTPEKRSEAAAGLSFYPLTAQIVAIGMMEVESGQGAVYYQNGGGNEEKFQEDGMLYFSCSEKKILELFWSRIKRYDRFITFNGRMFDCPFIMVRSAVNRVPAGKNLLPYRYSRDIHVDLADQLSFYDALRRRFNLHMWCKALGVASPKEDVCGLEVRRLYQEGKYADIARYCLGDVRATRELYLIWEECLNV